MDPAHVRWAAQQVVRQHEEGPDDDRATGRCAQCPEDDSECPLLAWAKAVLAVPA
jgi:hypothetical protein